MNDAGNVVADAAAVRTENGSYVWVSNPIPNYPSKAYVEKKRMLCLCVIAFKSTEDTEHNRSNSYITYVVFNVQTFVHFK